MTAKHRYTAQFLTRFITRDSKRIYSHAWLVEYTKPDSESDYVTGFSGSLDLARKEADNWVRRLTNTEGGKCLPFTIDSVEIAETTIGRNLGRAR